MAHGYLREFDEASDRDDERGRDERWRERGDWNDRDRGMMFNDRERGREHGSDHHTHHGIVDRLGDLPRKAFRGEDNDHRHWGGDNTDRSTWQGSSGQWSGEPGRSRFGSHPDDHYHSWRDKQIEALDRDYHDYCREREQQFHQDFDSWRQQRASRGNPGPLRTGMTQTGLSEDPSGMAEADAAASVGTTSPDPMDTATLGTNRHNKLSSD